VLSSWIDATAGDGAVCEAEIDVRKIKSNEGMLHYIASHAK
jgi:hypothetical protein